LGADANPPLPSLTRLSGLLAEWEADAAARHEAHRNGTPLGPVTGLPKSDRELGGALPPGLHIVHAMPGAGKTALCLQIGASCGCPCLLLTCEMAPLELLRRITARVTGTYLGRFKTGELTPAESLSLAERAAAACPDLWLLDGTRAYVTAADLRERAERVKGTAEHLLVMVDSVHSWADACGSEASEYETLNAHLAKLRALASGLNCAVLAVAERNRASMKDGGLSAGAGSRKLEYGAVSLWDLKREADAKEDIEGEVPLTLFFVKNRNGAPGKAVEMRFCGRLQRFREA